jgi:hypothetical protein
VADRAIADLATVSPAAGDRFVIGDASDADKTKAVLYQNIGGGLTGVPVSTALTGQGVPTLAVTQAAHGFALGDLVYYNGSAYAKAKADAAATAEVYGMVTAVTTNTFVLVPEGYVTGLTGLTAGAVYYLSDAVAGTMTATAPTTAGSINKLVFQADSTTSGWAIRSRGIVVALTTVGAAGKGPRSDGTNLVNTYPAGDLTTATDGATVTFALAASQRQIVTLGGNRTLALSGDADGMSFTVVLKQDGTGGRTVTWWSGIKWAGGATPTLTATAGKYDVFAFVRIAAGEYLGFQPSLNH